MMTINTNSDSVCAGTAHATYRGGQKQNSTSYLTTYGQYQYSGSLQALTRNERLVAGACHFFYRACK